MRRPGNASWPPPGSWTPVRTTASRCCSCSTVPNAAPRASTFSCGADDSAVTSSPLPRGSGVRSTCTGTPAARAVATGATWSFPDRASTTSPARGSAGVVAGRSGTPAATGPTGAAVAVAGGASACAATVSSSGRARSSPPTASVSVAGSTTRASRASTLTSPASASGAAGTTRVPPACCAAQSWARLPDGQQRLRSQPGDLVGDRRRVGGIRARRRGEQHRGAERDRGRRRPGLPAGVAVGGQHDDGGAGVERGAGGHRQRHRSGGREHGRRLRGTAEPGRGRSTPGSPPSPCTRRAPRRTPSARLPTRVRQPRRACPARSPTASTRSGDPPIRPHMSTVGAAAPMCTTTRTVPSDGARDGDAVSAAVQPGSGRLERDERACERISLFTARARSADRAQRGRAMSAPPDELPGRTRPPVRPARLVLALLLVVAAAVALLPDLLGLDHRSPFAQLVSFRPAMLAGLIVLAVAALGGGRRPQAGLDARGRPARGGRGRRRDGAAADAGHRSRSRRPAPAR